MERTVAAAQNILELWTCTILTIPVSVNLNKNKVKAHNWKLL